MENGPTYEDLTTARNLLAPFGVELDADEFGFAVSCQKLGAVTYTDRWAEALTEAEEMALRVSL